MDRHREDRRHGSSSVRSAIDPPALVAVTSDESIGRDSCNRSSSFARSQKRLINHNMFWFVSFVLGLADSALPLLVRLADLILFLLGGIVAGRRPILFKRGLGDLQTYVERRDVFYRALDEGKPVTDFLQAKDILWEEQPNPNYFLGVTVQQASFSSPLGKHLPSEATKCIFHLVQPISSAEDSRENDDPQQNEPSTFVIMLPATGEETIHSRLLTAVWNARVHGWSTLILTAAFYGVRRPRDEQPIFMETVANQLLQTQATAEETALLTEYLLRSSVNNQVVLTGFSCGGACSLAALAATLPLLADYPERRSRLAVAPLAGTTSHAAYADGMLLSCIGLEACANVVPDLRISDTTAATDEEAVIADYVRKVLRDSELKPSRMLRHVVETGIINKSRHNTCPQRREPIRIGAICVHACQHDKFVTEKYTQEVLDNLNQHAKCGKTVAVKWLAGGHSFVGAMSPYFLYHIIAQAVMDLRNNDV